MAIKLTKSTDPKRLISIHKFWFKFFGQWYSSHSTFSIIFILHFLYRILIWWMLSIFPVGGEIIYLFHNGDDVGKVAEGLYLMLSEAYMVFKLINFFYNRRKVLLLIDHLNSEEFYATEPEHIIFIENAIKKGRFVSKGYLYMCLMAIIVGCIMPITEEFEVLPTNVKYPFFDVLSSPAYQIVYIMQIYSKTAVVLLDGVLDTILPAFIAHALGQLDILTFNLENIQMLTERSYMRKLDPQISKKIKPDFIKHDTIFFDKMVKEKLNEIIKHHVNIVSYIANVEEAFSAAAAIQFMLSGLVICLVGIKILSIEDPMSHPLQLLWTLIYFCCMMSEVFMLCWFGDEVIWKSEHLQTAAFNCNWIEYSEDVKKSLKIFRERIKKPLRLTAGKIFTLSLDTFTNLLKWSYNAFAVMRNMKN